jgi:putative spermidine/putrescine transport system substrate-binding protein
MLSRRDFLVGTSSLFLSQFLLGCGGRKETLKIFLLRNSLPAQLIGDFKKQLEGEKTIYLQPEAQIKDLFNLLEAWQKPVETRQKERNWLPVFNTQLPTVADVISLGDYWLESAIEKQLIEPIETAQLSQWQKLPEPWQKLVKRNNQGRLDPSGAVWGAPYRTGMTLMVYNREKFAKLGWQPQDWRDLWRKELQGKISLLDLPREVIGLTLKKLGYSYNTNDLTAVENLEAELSSLNRQTKFYDDRDYLQPLILEDTWLAVGWSSDILPILKKYKNLQAVAPQSGTSLWADLWVRPKRGQERKKQSKQRDFLDQWLDFCWQSSSANQISLFSNGTSPISLSIKPQELPANLPNNPLIIFDRAVLAKSEFLEPLSKKTTEQYLSLWQKMRKTSLNR